MGPFFTAVQYALIHEDNTMDVYAHELGHSLGLPDLYDNPIFSLPTHYGIGEYGLMSYRPENPPHPCAWSKIKAGWIDPIIVEIDDYYEFKDIARNPVAYILRNKSHSEDEYFLVANRQHGINYDLDLNDTGIIIYHLNQDHN